MTADREEEGQVPKRATSFFDDSRRAALEPRAFSSAQSGGDRGSESSVNTDVVSGVNSAATEPDNSDAFNATRSGVVESEPPESAAGRLPAEARRALVSLLRMGVIVAAQKPKLFEQICRYEKRIQAHLADMYLRLLLDAKAGVALVLQREVAGDGDEEDDIHTLIVRRALSLYDTLLLLVLRKYYQEREAAGEQRIIMDIERIEAYLTPFLPLTNSSRSDRRALNAALKKMSDKKIVSAVRGEDERYEITPVIRYVVSAAFLEQLLEQYQHLARESGVASQ